MLNVTRGRNNRSGTWRQNRTSRCDVSVNVSDSLDYNSCDVNRQQITERRGELLSVISFPVLSWGTRLFFVLSRVFFFGCTFFFFSFQTQTVIFRWLYEELWEHKTFRSVFKLQHRKNESFPSVSCFCYHQDFTVILQLRIIFRLHAASEPKKSIFKFIWNKKKHIYNVLLLSFLQLWWTCVVYRTV